MIKRYKIFFSVGEFSGDLLASKLITSLKIKTGYKFDFIGIAGPKMIEAGKIVSIFPIQDLSVTGYLEIIPKIPKILFRFIQTIKYIKKIDPDLIITVDSPGFNFFLIKVLKKFFKIRIPIVHYVAPTFWAYKPERVKECAKLFDHMFILFPFEQKFFDKVNLKYSYISNSIVADNIYNKLKKSDIKKRYNLIGNKIITIFPGSRMNELKYHLPTLKKYIIALEKEYKNIFFIIPTLSHLKSKILKVLDRTNILVITNDIDKNYLISASDLILCKSGSTVLEIITKKIPLLVFYKMNKLTAYFIKRKLQIKYITICNIVMKKEVIPELIQENFNLDNLLLKTEYLIKNKSRISEQLKNFDIFLSKLSFRKDINTEPQEIIINYLNSNKSGT